MSFGSLTAYLKSSPSPLVESTSMLTLTPSPTPTLTPSPTASSTPEESSTPTPTVTASPTSKATAKPTATPSATPTNTPTPTVTPTATVVSIATAAPTPVVAGITAPSATPDVWSPGNLEPWFAQYAGQYGVDKNALEIIANCESHFNPNAQSPNGLYVGLFQFSASAWTNYRGQMGLDANLELRKNPEESIKTGAFMMSKRGTAPWPSCI